MFNVIGSFSFVLLSVNLLVPAFLTGYIVTSVGAGELALVARAGINVITHARLLSTSNIITSNSIIALIS